tara:strand:+ start:4726 stop:6753 length:2028 start_codon:yes stop_codon:yes gene_type:complete
VPDAWETFRIEFKGGLVTNLSPLQQAINAPGSARILRNYEPSIDGGYKRIQGYEKFDSVIMAPYGNPVVHGGSQSSTTLIIGAIHTTPAVGDTLTIAGVSGTYTVAGGGVSYNTVTNRATLTLTGALNSSPANGALVTFVSVNTTNYANGITYFNDKAVVAINADILETSGSGYTKINKPNYGSPLIDGASQTGTTLVADAFDTFPQAGDVFTISNADGSNLAAIDKTYRVATTVSSYSDAGTKEVNILIDPELASSPSDNAVITFISSDREGAINTRFDTVDFTGTKTLVLVDGLNAPAMYNGTTFTPLNSAPADVIGAKIVAAHKNHLFYGKGRLLSFGAPLSTTDFASGNGGGTIGLDNDIVAIKSFRDQLIVFTDSSIFRLNGDALSSFNLQPVTRNIGCTQTDSVQEIGGDVVFMAPDGLRLLSATERIGDFGLAPITKKIQGTFNSFVKQHTEFFSLVIRNKSQYRLLGWNNSFTRPNAQGLLFTQFASPGESSVIDFAETRGIQATACASVYAGTTEFILFAGKEGYLHRMENDTSSFDGNNIATTFATPFYPINDPLIRKTIYKAQFYLDPEGRVNFNLNLKFDFDEANSVVMPAVTFTNSSSSSAQFYGIGEFGTATYGAKLQKVFSAQTTGSGKTISAQFEADNNTDVPYALDALTLEYATHARR